MEMNEAVTALGALAQDKRLEIFRLLVQAGPKGLSVGEIGKAVSLPGATLTFHLKELTHAGLLIKNQQGRFNFYSPDFQQMNQLLAFLTENCCQGSRCAPESPDSGTCGSKENIIIKEETQ